MIWKYIPGYKNLYSVSEFGHIRRDKNGRGICKAGKILAQSKNKKGYFQIGICKNKRKKTFFISRIVALAFFGKCPKNYSVNHKDTIKSNNHFSNLEYVTHQENMRHAFKNGCFKEKPKGSHHINSKVSEEQVINMRKEYKTTISSTRKLAKKYGLCKSNITSILKRHTWKHV